MVDSLKSCLFKLLWEALVNNCYINSIEKMPEDDKVVTISELVQEGAKDEQCKAAGVAHVLSKTRVIFGKWVISQNG